MTWPGPAAPIIHSENTDLMNVLLRGELVHSEDISVQEREGMQPEFETKICIFILGFDAFEEIPLFMELHIPPNTYNLQYLQCMCLWRQLNLIRHAFSLYL